jgi:hypothetical protein
MILDKPKRRAETMVGLLEVSGGDKSTVARDQRTRRALKDAGDHFGLTISIGEMTGYLHTSRNFARLAITAVIHSESIESRWARALDMIRDQYGLTIEWEREEVWENQLLDSRNGQTNPAWERQEVRERNPAPQSISDRNATLGVPFKEENHLPESYDWLGELEQYSGDLEKSLVISEAAYQGIESVFENHGTFEIRGVEYCITILERRILGGSVTLKRFRRVPPVEESFGPVKTASGGTIEAVGIRGDIKGKSVNVIVHLSMLSCTMRLVTRSRLKNRSIS